MKGFVREWKEMDLKDIANHLLVVGELSSECYCCHEVGIDKTARSCPKCKAYFKYIGFRRKLQITYLKKLKDELPNITLIDFEDFKKAMSQRDARNLLGM